MVNTAQTNRHNSTFIFAPGMALVTAVILVLSAPVGFSQSGYVLLVQQTPVDGGTVTPQPGIHSYGVNEAVIITATSAVGYQFLYWLGDVSEPGSITTTVVLDGPKIIVAVFERVEYGDLVLDEDEAPRASLGRGGLLPAVRNFRIGGGGGGGAFHPGPEPFTPVTRNVEITEEPIAEEEDEFPVPIPEPSTLALLAAMAPLILSRRSKTLGR